MSVSSVGEAADAATVMSAGGGHRAGLAGPALVQRQELLENTTPVLRLWEGIVAVPLIGTLDSNRSQVVMESLLNGIVEEQAEIAILDITGVPMVDTLVAQHLMKTAMAVRLMGAERVISGIRPQIAQTIVALGIDLGGTTTRATLSDALKYGLEQTGVRLGTGRPRRYATPLSLVTAAPGPAPPHADMEKGIPGPCPSSASGLSPSGSAACWNAARPVASSVCSVGVIASSTSAICSRRLCRASSSSASPSDVRRRLTARRLAGPLSRVSRPAGLQPVAQAAG